MQQTIKHTGTVVLVEHNHIRVSVVAQSACSTCHAKSVCMAGEQTEKLIDVYAPSDNFSLGEQVEVTMLRDSGWRAVVIAYITPFILLMAVLLIAIGCGLSEPLAGLLSIGVVAIYYFIIYLLRNRISSKITFSARKLNSTNINI